MRLTAICFLAIAAMASSWAASDDDYSATLQRSLARSRAVFPDSARPDTVLGAAVQARIDWLQQHEPSAFSDPEWPMKVATSTAKALGLIPRPNSASPQSPPTVPALRDAPRALPALPAESASPGRRYLATVTKNFSVVGATFRKNQQIVLESLQNDNKRGTTIVDGVPYLLWLDNIKILREIPPGENTPALVKVESAKYGFPGKTAYSVAGMVQSLAAPGPSGAPQIHVSDALLTPNAAQKLNTSIAPMYVTDPSTGKVTLGIPFKLLTVTYSLNGQKKTRQAYEGQTLTLD
ncbi:hypothetical protein BH09VER1_BH09VER1_01880 [soil metagenome]